MHGEQHAAFKIFRSPGHLASQHAKRILTGARARRNEREQAAVLAAQQGAEGARGAAANVDRGPLRAQGRPAAQRDGRRQRSQHRRSRADTQPRLHKRQPISVMWVEDHHGCGWASMHMVQQDRQRESCWGLVWALADVCAHAAKAHTTSCWTDLLASAPERVRALLSAGWECRQPGFCMISCCSLFSTA